MQYMYSVSCKCVSTTSVSAVSQMLLCVYSANAKQKGLESCAQRAAVVSHRRYLCKCMSVTTAKLLLENLSLGSGMFSVFASSAGGRSGPPVANSRCKGKCSSWLTGSCPQVYLFYLLVCVSVCLHCMCYAEKWFSWSGCLPFRIS